MNRLVLKKLLLDSVTNNIRQIQLQIQNLAEDAQNDAKSSAGDKHETGLAMMHLEQEKLNAKLVDLLQIQQKVEALPVDKIVNKVTEGAIVITNKVVFYISIAWPQLVFEKQTVICVSKQAPIVQVLLNQIVGSKIVFNSNTYEIVEIL